MQPISVAMISKTALAAAPYEASKCLNKYANVRCRWIALKTSYADGRVFPHDMVWTRDYVACQRLIENADIVHIQNEAFPFVESLIRQRKGKGVLIQFHSCPQRATYNMLRGYTNYCYTLDQPMQKRVYGGLPSLPNMIDPEEHKPRADSGRDKLVVAFAPTNRWPKNMIGSKGVDDVQRILNSVRPMFIVDIFNSLSYEENLRRKRDADIIIDDVIGDTFHRTALEGCCFGLVVLTSHPCGAWLDAKLNSLPDILKKLAGNRELVKEFKKRSREWITGAWHPKNLVSRYVDAYKQVLHGTR